MDPNLGVDLDYFVRPDGFAKETAKMEGQGPTWINGLTTVSDKEGAEFLYAKYVKVAKPMRVYRQGLARFDDAQKKFVHRIDIPMDSPIVPGGHPFHHRKNGIDYVYFADPFPIVRIPATVDSIETPAHYESYTCYVGPPNEQGKYQVDRDEQGKLRFRWRPHTPPLSGEAQKASVASGEILADESFEFLRDAKTGKKIRAHGGSTYWNDYRSRWVMIVLESFGSSLLGELWLAESENPEGPWVYATKVVTHDKYSFYNPKQHPMLDQQGGRQIFFEGTYTSMFSGNPEQTPRYNYNQIMYRLDLDDPRLVLPVPVYQWSESDENDSPASLFSTARPTSGELDNITAEWFALDRHAEASVAVVRDNETGGLRISPSNSAEDDSSAQIVFYALPADWTDKSDAPSTSEALVPLYRYELKQGDRIVYATQDRPPGSQYERAASPLCLVWKSPDNLILPTADH